jgi:hypothetical protein
MFHFCKISWVEVEEQEVRPGFCFHFWQIYWVEVEAAAMPGFCFHSWQIYWVEVEAATMPGFCCLLSDDEDIAGYCYC